MRKLDLTTYDIEVNGAKLPFNIKSSLKNIILSTHNKHSVVTLLDCADIGRKLTSCTEDFILLEEAEYQNVLKPVNSYVGYREPDEIMVRRVLDAPIVEVAEKSNENSHV